MYYITICTQNGLCLFGEIIDGEMILNTAGKIIEHQWYDLINRFTHIELHGFVVMPNHVHGIIQIVGAGSSRPYNELSNVDNQNNYNEGHGNHHDKGRGDPAPTLGQIVAYFKYGTTKQINTMYNMSGTKLWQRNYYEHIVRDENDLNRIREYIANNPLRWQDDKYYKEPQD
jgi:REP element-mobilizing transposase RayT